MAYCVFLTSRLAFGFETRLIWGGNRRRKKRSSQSTVPSLISCKKFSVRLLLWSRRRYLLSTTTDRTSNSLQLDRWNLWSMILSLPCNSKSSQFRRKGGNNGWFCVILLFLMVISVVFLFYLLLRPLQNMQCFSLRSFCKKIHVKSNSNDASTEPELIETNADLNWTELI